MNAQHSASIPENLGLLFEVLLGWDAAGATAEPRHVAEVEERTGLPGVVGPRSQLLAELGVLERDGWLFRLTGPGSDLAGALASGNVNRAREIARLHLQRLPLTEDVRGIVRSNPLAEEQLGPLVATISGRNASRERDRVDVVTVLDLFAWAGLLARDETGRYELPEAPQVADGGSDGDSEDGERSNAESEAHALSLGLGVDSLEIDLDAKPEELEAVIRAIRRGLVPDEEFGNE